MKIIQIVTLKGEPNPPNRKEDTIYGLGDDGTVYRMTIREGKTLWVKMLGSSDVEEARPASVKKST